MQQILLGLEHKNKSEQIMILLREKLFALKGDYESKGQSAVCYLWHKPARMYYHKWDSERVCELAVAKSVILCATSGYGRWGHLTQASLTDQSLVWNHGLIKKKG